jgi:hypothetical protein
MSRRVADNRVRFMIADGIYNGCPGRLHAQTPG